MAKEIIDGYENRDVVLDRVTRHTSKSTGHGRLETRVCAVVSYGSVMERMFKDKFVGLKSIVGVKSERIIMATGERTEERRYYITSLGNGNPEEIANAIRQHWSIENNLYWQLDVTFREDYSKKVQNAARNFVSVSAIPSCISIIHSQGIHLSGSKFLKTESCAVGCISANLLNKSVK